MDSFKQNRPFVVPTLLTTQKMLEKAQQEGWATYQLTIEEVKTEVYKLYEADILIIAGTDPPNFSINYGSDLYQELVLMVEAGIPPMEVLKTATSNVGKAFQIPNLGTIKVGEEASLLLLTKNPLDNMQHLESVIGIWRKGQQVK